MIEKELDHILFIFVIVGENNDAHAPLDAVVIFLRQFNGAVLNVGLKLDNTHMLTLRS
jgi:hypothetical protein